MNVAIHEYRSIENYTQLPPDVVAGIGRCVNSAFDGRITEEDTLDHIAGNQILIATDEETCTIVGFTAAVITSPQEKFRDPSLTDRAGIYFAGAAIAQCAQRQGVYHQLNTHRLDFALTNNDDTIFTRTQNPCVVKCITNDLNQLVRERRINAYKVDHTIQQGAYPGMLTATRPITQGGTLDLDYERGDAAIVIWELKK